MPHRHAKQKRYERYNRGVRRGYVTRWRPAGFASSSDGRGLLGLAPMKDLETKARALRWGLYAHFVVCKRLQPQCDNLGRAYQAARAVIPHAIAYPVKVLNNLNKAIRHDPLQPIHNPILDKGYLKQLDAALASRSRCPVLRWTPKNQANYGGNCAVFHAG